MSKIFLYLFTSVLLITCKGKPQYNDVIPLHDNFTIESTIVNETRVINVWTPPSYEGGTDSLLVLYMPDGGIKEDFPHIANTLAKLIANKSIPPMILVGIENTERGRDLTGSSTTEYDAQFCPQTDGAKDFRAFITDELMPVINRKYRTNKQKGIIGESLAGLFVMETFFLQPLAFDFYIAMDPSIWWDNHILERKASEYLKAMPTNKTKLWFAGSSVKDISIHTNNLANTLKKSAPENLTWTYVDAPKEKHSTIFRATKEQALVWTFNNEH